MESITRAIIRLDDFPKWISRGSTWINQNGCMIDMANLPPCTCQVEFEWYRALKRLVYEGAEFVADEEINDAWIEWQVKEQSCEYCKRRRFQGFSGMKRLAADRKRRATMSERKRRLNKTSRKMEYVETDWDKD